MQRFLVIDSLRGIAVLMVTFGHLFGNIEPVLGQVPMMIHNIFLFGAHGVEIFFVISGFVIAYSIRNGSFSVIYFFKFGLRRLVRLDPPYWIVILLEIALIYISLVFYPNLGTTLPTIKQLGAHMIYAQELLGLGHLLPIFWTLCYEVQFYLFFPLVTIPTHV